MTRGEEMLDELQVQIAINQMLEDRHGVVWMSYCLCRDLSDVSCRSQHPSNSITLPLFDVCFSFITFDILDILL